MKSINEGVIGDMVMRSSGKRVRTEDMYEVIKKLVDVYINLFVNKVFGAYDNTISDFLDFVKDYYNNIKVEDAIKGNEDYFNNGGKEDLINYIRDNWDDISDKIDEIFGVEIDGIDECDCSVGLAVGDVSGMGQATLPGEVGCCGSGDLPMPTGKVYQQVAPFGTFVKTIKKKKKKFRKEDEPCACKDNPKIYSHVDDFREYVDRTYNQVDKLK